MSAGSPKGILRPGWSAEVEDYAIAGGWTRDGELLVVGDAAGGVFGFDGTSGATRWAHSGIHVGGLLALAVHPSGDRIATAGQDGQVRSGTEGRRAVCRLPARACVLVLDGARLAATLPTRPRLQRRRRKGVESAEHPSTVSASPGSVPTSWRPHATAAWRSSLRPRGAPAEPRMEGFAGVDGAEPRRECRRQDNSVHFGRHRSGLDDFRLQRQAFRAGLRRHGQDPRDRRDGDRLELRGRGPRRTPPASLDSTSSPSRRSPLRGVECAASGGRDGRRGVVAGQRWRRRRGGGCPGDRPGRCAGLAADGRAPLHWTRVAKSTCGGCGNDPTHRRCGPHVRRGSGLPPTQPPFAPPWRRALTEQARERSRRSAGSSAQAEAEACTSSSGWALTPAPPARRRPALPRRRRASSSR